MTNKQKFTPDWSEAAPLKGSYRSIFKIGHPDVFRHPSDAWYEMIKEDFDLTDQDFKQKQQEGHEQVCLKQKARLSEQQIDSLSSIVGQENIETNDVARTKYSHGKTAEEALDLRQGVVRYVADVVVHPRDKSDVQKIVSFCHDQKIPVTVFGGGSSVTLGIRPILGGVILVMTTHMNQVLEINEKNQTARVQAGCMGPSFEEALNNAPSYSKTALKYTCGHFPQSFEMSTVGGWVVTLGSGQTSTYYGDAYDLVISQEYVTPTGSFKTSDYPATATGPKVNDIMKGSEGAFGILVEVTMKIFRYMPENRQYFSFMFHNWEDTVNASREISQGEFGLPAVFRISDPEETERGLRLHGFNGTISDKVLMLMGYRKMQRCICMGTIEGDASFTGNVRRQIKKIGKRHGALSLGKMPVKRWEPTRYLEPYMREDLMDYGILSDTLETAVTWDNLHRLHQGVRSFMKKRPGTICMSHSSHFYPQGTNLYFIFIFKLDQLEEYKQFQSGIIDAILEHGGSLSHHHGIGEMIAPWMEKQLGQEQMAVLQALKKHFDPNCILNPGKLFSLN